MFDLKSIGACIIKQIMAEMNNFHIELFVWSLFSLVSAKGQHCSLC